MVASYSIGCPILPQVKGWAGFECGRPLSEDGRGTTVGITETASIMNRA